MNYDTFIGQVQSRARLGSGGDAERAIRATLQTLAERLAGGEAENLAAQLPPGIAQYLTRDRAVAEVSDRLSRDQFFQRIAQREGADLPDAVYHARVVLEVLKEAVSAGELQDVRQQLPPELEQLFDAGSQGELPNR